IESSAWDVRRSHATQRKAAGGALTAKQAPRRPGTAPALGLRAGRVVTSLVEQTTIAKKRYQEVLMSLVEVEAPRPSADAGATPHRRPAHAQTPPRPPPLPPAAVEPARRLPAGVHLPGGQGRRRRGRGGRADAVLPQLRARHGAGRPARPPRRRRPRPGLVP